MDAYFLITYPLPVLGGPVIFIYICIHIYTYIYIYVYMYLCIYVHAKGVAEIVF